MEIPDGPAGHGTKYQGSKILAHQATTDWVESHKPDFLVLTFHPTFVIGPSLFQRKAGDIDSINRFFFDTVRTGTPIIPPVLVDVRDVADAFVKALVASVPKQQEFILSGPPTTWVEVCSEVQSLYPDEGFKSGPPDEEQPSMTVSTRVARELLGIQWKSVRELVCGVIDQQLALKAQPA
jgi:nucleoside-diphosphate-sugar epimerase